jgi:molecular chaperone DnaK
MDQRIFEHLADRFQQQTGIDIRGDLKAEIRVREAGEIAKIELSTSTTAHVSLPFLAARGVETFHLDTDLTRTELERLLRPVVERCRAPVEQALRDAHVEPHNIDRIVFVGGPTRMPMVRAFFEEIFGRKAEMGVDPMECVAAGAAIQAGVLAGEVGQILLVDVTPLTLGVETLGGIATPLIARNTPIPVKKAEIFTTAADLQPSVTIHVFQGERPMSADNASLGEFTLDGLPPAPRGVPKIEITFDIDANGILNVTAKDQATAKERSLRVTGSTRLPEQDKQRMVEEAQRYAEQDKQRREAAEKLNAADSICYQAEKTLADFGPKLSEDLRKRIEAALREVREALAKRDAALATSRAESLKTVLQEAGKALYSQAAQPAPQATPGATGAEHPPGETAYRDRVVDAEYQEAKR